MEIVVKVFKEGDRSRQVIYLAFFRVCFHPVCICMCVVTPVGMFRATNKAIVRRGSPSVTVARDCRPVLCSNCEHGVVVMEGVTLAVRTQWAESSQSLTLPRPAAATKDV